MMPVTFQTRETNFKVAIVLMGVCLELDGAPVAFRWQK